MTGEEHQILQQILGYSGLHFSTWANELGNRRNIDRYYTTQFLSHTDMQISLGIGKLGAAQCNKVGQEHNHLADWLPTSSENTKS
jgi:hypothetical protein